MNVSRKAVFGFVSNVVLFAAGLVVSKLGLHLSSTESVELSAALGSVANLITGLVVKEVDHL